ncbi:terminase large subunit domain-containing protein [Paraclostridium sordellii]|uniref:Phage terminase large subunit n=1 Tax=Paraclostridium sordellii TaxID=1505 RepID=A0A9P1KWF7_PARSO|nr:terminase large subunit [Paeniclostridium sordellii]CEN31397.1 putative phage terminase large subunit [[Clostridium] sordellii] [Paeniclostridium sordellii]
MKFNKHIDRYINLVESGSLIVGEDIKKLIVLIKDKLSQPNIFIDSEKIDKAIEKIEQYFPYKLLDWEKFIIGLVHCYYDDETLVWNTFLLVMGRGAGKNGFISALSWYLTTSFHGKREYNVDIVANSEDQAKTSFEDVYNVIDDNKKLQKAFYYTKEKIVFKKTKSYIKYNTSNARTKDGLRPACIIFDEIHEYEDYSNIKVFKSALGKKEHSRTFMITTNGNVRGGVLDDYLEIAEAILKGENKTMRLLPIIYRLDDDKEVDDKEMWNKANPSFKFFKDLRIEMEQEYEDMKYQPQLAIEFMTKRMNRPAQDSFTVVAEWDKIVATNQKIPTLDGCTCIGGVDYASIRDFVGCGLLFKFGDKRVWLHHTFICHKALTLPGRQIKFDIELAKKMKLCTVLKEDSVNPKYIVDWFLEMSTKYNIVDIKADSYRKSLLASAFNEVGLPLSDVRNGYITHNKIAPLLEQLFANENIIFGDDPMMRWYTNNVYVDIDKKGNKSYKKIEPKLRKTDGFFAFIHALSEDEKIPQSVNEQSYYGCYSY